MSLHDYAVLDDDDLDLDGPAYELRGVDQLPADTSVEVLFALRAADADRLNAAGHPAVSPDPSDPGMTQTDLGPLLDRAVRAAVPAGYPADVAADIRARVYMAARSTTWHTATTNDPVGEFLAGGDPRDHSGTPLFREPREDERQATAEASKALADEAEATHYERQLAHERRKQRLREDARALNAAEDAAKRIGEIPEFVSLTDLLARPDDPLRFRVAGLQAVAQHVLVVGPRKAGKSTLVGGYVRSTVDGDRFLGAFDAEPVRRVAIIDLEMGERQGVHWLRDQGISNTDAVTAIFLRGQLETFNIMVPSIRQEWVERLRGHDLVILDPLRPILDALGLDENREASKFLAAWTSLLHDAGIFESMVCHHSGHLAGRARGDSGIEAWADAIWYLEVEKPGKNEDEADMLRTFRALGRDVDVRRGALEFDPETRRLTYRLEGGEAGRQIAAARHNEQRERGREIALDFVRRQNEAGVEPASNPVAEYVYGNSDMARAASRNLVSDLINTGMLRAREHGTAKLLSIGDPFPMRPTEVNPFATPPPADDQ